MSLNNLVDYRLLDNVSQYMYTIAGEFTPDTSHLHSSDCKCSIFDRLRCDYFGMGTCVSRDARARRKERNERKRAQKERLKARALAQEQRHIETEARFRERHRMMTEEARLGLMPDVRNDIQNLILETLEVIRTLVNNEQDPPHSLLKLNLIADEEKGWIMVVRSLIHTIPESDPLGPAVISLFLDECPLPSRESIQTLLTSLHLSTNFVEQKHMTASWHKNMCIVLGSLAEKMAGAPAVQLFNENIRGYLMKMICYGLTYFPDKYGKSLEKRVQKEKSTHCVRMFALLALEKFAQTKENQMTICKLFKELHHGHPLVKMEEYLNVEDVSKYWQSQQEGFCAQWALDNIFVPDNRVYSFQKEQKSQNEVRAMLNHEDVSEYLKIGPNGLEARCDVSSFESVRCTFEVMDGVWYYEATVLTSGVMQIGLATKRSRFLNHEGYGIGDDSNSVAYDGCRQLVWYNARSIKHEHDNWNPGDVVGILLDIPQGEVWFYLNGIALREPNREFLKNRQSKEGVFAAASFMSFQQCRFNFGADRFKFHPGCAFRTFNDYGKLTDDQKTILPRKLRMEKLQKEQIPDDYCMICYDDKANTQLKPCLHDGFCETCSEQLEQCPLCRAAIKERVVKENSRLSRSMDKSGDRSIDLVKSPSQLSNVFIRAGSQRKSIRAASYQPSEAEISTETPTRNMTGKDISRRHTQV